jgi:hypothetical protein
MNLTSSRTILIGFCLLFSGCEGLIPESKQIKTKVVKENRVPVRRFVLTKYDAGVAFDTQTGQLCKTWEWTPIGKEPPVDKESGGRAQRTLGEFAPTCVSLYKEFPSGTGTTSENLPDE